MVHCKFGGENELNMASYLYNIEQTWQL